MIAHAEDHKIRHCSPLIEVYTCEFRELVCAHKRNTIYVFPKYCNEKTFTVQQAPSELTLINLRLLEKRGNAIYTEQVENETQGHQTVIKLIKKAVTENAKIITVAVKTRAHSHFSQTQTYNMIAKK